MNTVEDCNDVVQEWRLEQMLEALSGNSTLALKLLLHDADYRDVARAVELGASHEEIENIYC